MPFNPENISIAVLPFKFIGASKEFEYISEGITEEIIHALARIESIKVISRTSSFYFKGKEAPLKEIGERLNVQIILEGSVRLEGKTLRIGAQLLQAEDAFHIWSGVWDRELEKILELQTEISLLIADKLREQLGHFEIKESTVQTGTKSTSAMDQYMKARYHANKWNPVDVQTSISHYLSSIEADPEFVEAYVGLADAYSFMATTQFMSPIEAWQKTVEYTQKAHGLNPENAGVHYQLANMAFFTDCNYPDSFEHITQALKYQPNYPEAQQFTAFLYLLSGDFDQARQHLQFALALDPLSRETLFYKAYYLYREKEFQKAKELLEEILTENPDNLPAMVVRAYCMLFLEEYDQLLEELDEAGNKLIPHEQLGLTCMIYIFRKDKEKIDLQLSALEKEAEDPKAFQAHSYLFLAYARLFRFDEAFQLLDRVLNYKSSVLLISYSDPLAGPIMRDKRYSTYKTKLYGRPEPFKEANVKKALMDEKTASEQVEKVLAFIEKEKSYLNPSLSLRDLAHSVQIHPNHLSWLLNEYIGRNFNKFINSYRLEHFKELIANPGNAHISIIGLAYESGFNSKTVFNTFFKKETGMTPVEYLKSLS